MKNNYLEELKVLLSQYQIEDNELKDIIADYEDMYDNWKSTGMTDDEVEAKLGAPKNIIRDLTDGIKRKPRKKKKTDKLIAISPFISILIFLALGFGWELWQYSWMAFLLIPITAIVVEQGFHKGGHFITAISPFVATVVFIVLGFTLDLWHPGWMIYLIIPVSGILSSKSTMRPLELLTALSPFASIVAFFILGEYGYWQQAWLVFLSIPMIGALNETNVVRKLMIESFIIIGIIGYLYVGYTYEEWTYALFAFAPAAIYLIFIGDIRVGFFHAPRRYKIVILSVLTLFVVIGLLTNAWHLAWLVFLGIPVYAILTESKGKERLIAITPFIAVTVFMLVGFLFDGFHYAWVIFLIIPVTAIIVSD